MRMKKPRGRRFLAVSLSIDKAHSECPSGLAIQIQRASATFPLRYVHPFGFESRSCLDIVYGGGW